MFERFTNRARHSVVLAQEEARRLQHNYIGTEHLLLGVLGEPDGIGGQALATFGLSLDSARELVEARVKPGKKHINGHIPFTPRAKKVLELALREALALNHNYIGTEHLVLGLIREADGVGAQVLAAQAGDLLQVRMAVLDLVPAAAAGTGRRWLRRRTPDALEADEPDELRTTAAAEVTLEQAARLAGPLPVGSHHLLLATLGDPNTAAARVLTDLGLDLEQTRAALRAVDVSGTSDEQPEEAGRRTMLIRVGADTVSIEASDETLVTLARRVLETVGEQTDEPGVIRGELPISVSLADVWRATEASLQDIRRRASSIE